MLAKTVIRSVGVCLRGPAPCRSFGRGWRAGTTLVEVLLALTVTSLVAAAVAALLFSTSYGTSSHDDMRDVLVSNEVAATRLGAALRASKMVLAKGDNYLVLWMADTEVNDEPDLSELRRVERDPATNELRSYRAPASLPKEDDTMYELVSTDFNAITDAMKGSANLPETLWATDVTEWTTTADAADPHNEGFVGFRITTSMHGVSATKVGGATLKNH